MHRCLNIREIFELVCDEINSDYDPISLFALAQTCRVFHAPAIACLWKEMFDLVPVIKCAGRDLWEERGSELHLQRPISSSDVAIMRKYAPHVWYFEGGIDVAQDVWKALHQALGGAALFSGVRSIEIVDSSALDYISVFSGQYLTSLRIQPGDEIALSHARKLADFSAECPHVKRVTLSGVLEVEVQRLLITALGNWQNLSQFDLYNITIETLQALSRYHSSSLESLSFIQLMPSEEILDQLFTTTGPVVLPFPALKQVSFGLCKISSAIILVGYLVSSSEHLQSLAIRLHDSAPSIEMDWLSLLRSIRSHSHNIKHLSIGEEPILDEDSQDSSDDGTGNGRAIPRLSNALLSVLATDFRMLTSVNIVHTGGYDIADGDFEPFTEALPLLKEFRLIDGMDNFNRITFKTTITVLLYFARNCPDLSHLSLGFDGRAHKVPELSGLPIQLSKLEVLDVSVSPVDDPQLVADFLSTIYPKLLVIRCVDEEDNVNNPELTVESWYEICDILELELEPTRMWEPY